MLAAYIESVGGPEERVYSAARAGILTIHETLGMSLFAIVLMRLLWGWVDRPPNNHPGPPWIVRSARRVHALLYVLLVAIPLTAILGAWLEGHPLTLLGLEIAPWIGAGHRVGGWVSQIHTILGNALMWVAGLHTAAALAHHYHYRDDVLRSMLPAATAPASSSPSR